MKSFNQTLGRYASFGPVIIRVFLGGLFLLHGIDKFQGGISGVEDFFAANGVPAASLAAPLTAGLEVVVGVALIVGLFTRLAAAVLALILMGAIFWVKADGGILGSSELELAYIAGLLSLVLIGPGRLSVDEAMKTDETLIDLRSSDRATPAQPVSVG
jgi:putative oxidoreductase